MKTRMLVIAIVLFFSGTGFITPVFLGGSFGRLSESSPYLYAPCTENVTVNGKGEVEFRWNPVHPMRVRSYIFRLYLGFETKKTNLVISAKIDGRATNLRLPADTLDPKQTYSWVLVEIFGSGQKSDRSFCSFKIAGPAADTGLDQTSLER